MKIAIYKIVPEQDTNLVIFRNMEFVSEKNGGHIPAEIYECVYSGIVNANTLEDVFTVFNIYHPAGYRGRSLTASDVVEIIGADGNSSFFFCDSFGFKRVSFAKEKTSGRE